MKKIALTLFLFIGLIATTQAQDGMSSDAEKLSTLNCKMVALTKDKTLSNDEFYAKSKALNDEYEALKKECEKKYKDKEAAWKTALDTANKNSGC